MSGEVVWAAVPGDKVRPVVILTRTRIIDRLNNVVVAPVTSTIRNIRTEIQVGVNEGVRDGSVANLDNIFLLPTRNIARQCGSISPERWPEFCQAIQTMMAC